MAELVGFRDMTSSSESGFVGMPGPGGGGALAGAMIKTLLEIYSKTDENGVRTGDCGYRLKLSGGVVEIPAEFPVKLVTESVSGQPVNGLISGTCKLMYAGAGEVPAGYEEFHDRDIHGVVVTSPERVTISVGAWLALADSMLVMEMISKQAGTDLPEEEGL